MPGRGESGTRFAWPLAVIVVLAAAVRVAYVISQRHHLPLAGDSFFYAAGAQALAQGRGWVDPMAVFDNLRTAGHPPLYTLWLWIPAYVAEGHEISQFSLLLWSCIPGTATVLLCGLAGREIGGRRLGLAAAALAAVYPGLWVYDGSLLSETMAMFTVALVILLAYRYLNHPSPARVAWLGASCGLATLARSELVLTFVLVLVPVVLMARKRPWRLRVGWLAMAGAIGVAVVSPWVIFNVGRFEHRVLLTTSAGRTMAAANCDDTYYGDKIGFKSYECLDAAYARDRDPTLDETERDRQFSAIARRYMQDHPARVPVVVAARWGRILQVYEPRQEIKYNQLYRVQGRVATELQFWSFYLIAAAAIAGAFVLRRRGSTIFPLVAFPAVALIAVATTFGQWRYRATAEPAMVLLASGVLVAGWERFASRRGVPAGAERGEPPERTPEPEVSRT